MPIKREARYLNHTDIGKTISMYDRDTKRTCTEEILAIEQWPDMTRIWLPTDLNQEPYHLNPTQHVLITGKSTP